MWDGFMHVINIESDTITEVYKHHIETITAIAQ